jgi:hypothetical protein
VTEPAKCAKTFKLLHCADRTFIPSRAKLTNALGIELVDVDDVVPCAICRELPFEKNRVLVQRCVGKIPGTPVGKEVFYRLLNRDSFRLVRGFGQEAGGFDAL